ncbi:hypothetical protein AB0H49_10545 [Nocardia sp. NPDC050713]|uniref:hypothetical protein n=1 Tax=Nocardia sp. NPDC050713 TaxID=3154511 RepID=UPI0034084098
MPDAHTADKILDLAQSLNAAGQLFHVDGTSRHPHLTIFMSQFATTNIDSYLDHLNRLSIEGPVHASAFGLTLSANGYLEIGYNKSTILESLQRRVAEVANGLWTPSGDPEESGASELENRYERTAGYKLFGDLYRPHITLAAYARVPELTFPPLRDFRAFDFRFDELVVGRTDQYGSVIAVIDRIPLRSKRFGYGP